MSYFVEKKLGDLLTFQRGFDITKSEQQEGNIPIVSSSGISSFHNHSKANAPGVVIGRKGSLGTVHYLNTNYWPHDTTLWVKDFKGNEPRFIYYFLQTLHLENFDVGSSNPTLNRNHLHKIRVLFPKEQQKKITAVLSAYDDLIENNRRRIELLERMAEELYREWFVRFRFPGYQQAKSEKGLPVDWKRTGLGSLGTYLNGYAFKPSDLSLAGIPVIKIKEINGGVTAETPRNSGESVAKRYHFDDGTIIFSWSATLAVKVWDQGPGLLNQHLFKVAPAEGIPTSFLYFSIKFCLPIFDSLTTGSTMKHIKRKELDAVKIGLPGKAILEEFDRSASKLLQKKLKLSKANQLLVEVRNQLLTRLISGKLPIDQLDIQFPPSMREAAAALQEVAHA
ncbi:restriction endonuclease subunit S [Pseudomonas kielensis]|uniref:restriction endonuclease subunit S n=1 Tax=Pseudomonas kielensis TaxID=2762577 RepID=UPI0038AACCAA